MSKVITILLCICVVAAVAQDPPGNPGVGVPPAETGKPEISLFPLVAGPHALNAVKPSINKIPIQNKICFLIVPPDSFIFFKGFVYYNEIVWRKLGTVKKNGYIDIRSTT